MWVQSGGESGSDVPQNQFLKALVITGISAIGWKSLRLGMGDCFGMGIIMADFKQGGIKACSTRQLEDVSEDLC